MDPSFRITNPRAVGGLVSALLLWSVALPAASQFRPIEGREYREFHNPVNPVRGEAVVGLAFGPTDIQQRSTVVYAFVRDQYSGELHVETLSADGRFRGEGAYSGSTKGKEWVRLPLGALAPRDEKALPLRPKDAELAVAVRDPRGKLYPARWGEKAEDVLRIYINSRRGEIFLRAGKRVDRCKQVGIPQPVRFDTYCEVAKIDVPPSGELTLIRRYQFDEEPQKFQVHLP